jgi:hypothetical protein
LVYDVAGLHEQLLTHVGHNERTLAGFVEIHDGGDGVGIANRGCAREIFGILVPRNGQSSTMVWGTHHLKSELE